MNFLSKPQRQKLLFGSWVASILIFALVCNGDIRAWMTGTSLMGAACVALYYAGV